MPSPQVQNDFAPASLATSGEDAAVATSQAKAHGNLSKLMLDIAEARRLIRHNESLLQELHARLQRELAPIEKEYQDVRIETLRVLGGHLKKSRLKKREARQLREALCEFADELEESYGVDLETERVTLLDQEFMSEEEERLLDELEAAFDSQMDGFFKNRAGESSGERNRTRGADSSEYGDFETDRMESGPKRRRKTQGAKNKTAGKQNEEQGLAGDIRALYLLLARALHPDKESDSDRRLEKTAWMQKVTVAYASRNLADLLDILAQNPLESVGPYLSQAPLKMVQGFAKRLRRELTSLKKQAEGVWNNLHPHFRNCVNSQGLNDKQINRHKSETRKQVRFLKTRLDIYRSPEGFQEFLGLLGKYDWRHLM